MDNKKAYIHGFLCFVFFGLSAFAQSNTGNCKINHDKLQGVWYDSGYFTRTTSLDSINKFIKEHGGFKSKKNFAPGEYDMIIKGDSLSIYGDENKFEIDMPNCSLIITDSRTKRKKTYPIYLFTNKCIVIRNCSSDCSTLIFFKEQ